MFACPRYLYDEIPSHASRRRGKQCQRARSGAPGRGRSASPAQRAASCVPILPKEPRHDPEDAVRPGRVFRARRRATNRPTQGPKIVTGVCPARRAGRGGVPCGARGGGALLSTPHCASSWIRSTRPGDPPRGDRGHIRRRSMTCATLTSPRWPSVWRDRCRPAGARVGGGGARSEHPCFASRLKWLKDILRVESRVAVRHRTVVS